MKIEEMGKIQHTEMYDGDGNLYRGKIGEIHRIQTVEYDFMHTGEVVTECGDMTYNMDAEDFRNSFEMVHDEEGLEVEYDKKTNKKTLITGIEKSRGD
ncbi:hypothetical protein LCGC14_2963000 [marine sediment metagenome]|uniref:Uncharacterized protein n=1 Tax=marine sediment metagenome TaxID=412755 RepID=A0A0F8XBM5_9ZZZZ